MKKIMLVIFSITLLVSSCSNQPKEKKAESKTDENTEVEESADPKKLQEAKNCNEFIDQYEKWMDNYIMLIEKYMKNPMDATLMEEYMKVTQEGNNWMTQWGNLMYCASKEKYKKRFEEISAKAEKKLKELSAE